MWNLKSPTRLLPFGSLLCVLAMGCGDGRPKTYPVQATVRVNGQPAVGANVTLHPLEGKLKESFQHRPFGKVGEDSSVKFSTFKPGDGVPAGNYIVTIYWPAGEGGDRDKLNGQYQSPERSNPLTVTVNQEKTEFAPIDIQTASYGFRN